MLRKAAAPPMARRSHQAREQATPCTGRSPTQGTGRAIVRPCCSGVALPSSSPLDYPCYLLGARPRCCIPSGWQIVPDQRGEVQGGVLRGDEGKSAVIESCLYWRGSSCAFCAV